MLAFHICLWAVLLGDSIIYSQGSNSSQCSMLCVSPRQEGQRCQSIETTVCAPPDVTGPDDVITQDPIPVSLESFEVIPLNNSPSDFALNISFILEDTNSSQNVSLAIGQYSSQEVTSNVQSFWYCRTYHVMPLTYYTAGLNITQNVQLVLSDACWTGINESATFSVAFSSLESGGKLTYLLRTPDNLTNILDPPSSAQWKTIVAIAAVPSNSSILTYFQPAPPQTNITSYLITLHANQTSPGFHLNQTLFNNGTAFQFHEVPCPETFFLTVQDSGCQSDECSISESARIFLPHFVEPTSPTSPSTAVLPSSSPAAPQDVSMATDIITHYSTEDSSQTEVVPSTPKTGSNQKVQIIVGSVCGVVGLVVLIIIIYCIYRCKCHSGAFSMMRFHNPPDFDPDIALDASGTKIGSSVLILYSYDCEAHERVVVELATYLKHVFCCQVALDIWEQAELQNQGASRWLQERLATCSHALILCSAGARYKCARGKQFRLRQQRPIPDTFALAVDLVAEQLREARFHNQPTPTRFVVGLFDYAGDGAVPPKLDMVQRVQLMRDVQQLYCLVHNLRTTTGAKSLQGVTADTYHQTATGRQLHEALQAAHRYFEENPDWLGHVLEPISPPLASNNHQKHSREGSVVSGTLPVDMHPNGKQEVSSSSQENLLDGSVDSEGMSEGDPLQRQRRKLKGEEPVERSTSPDPLSLQVPPSLSPSGSFSGKNPPAPLTEWKPASHTWPQLVNGHAMVNGSLKSEDDSLLDEEDQLQRDIDALHNFDKKWFQSNDSPPHSPNPDGFSSLLNGGFVNPSFKDHYPPLTANNSRIDEFVIDFSDSPSHLFPSSSPAEASPNSTTLL